MSSESVLKKIKHSTAMISIAGRESTHLNAFRFFTSPINSLINLIIIQKNKTTIKRNINGIQNPPGDLVQIGSV